MVPMPLLDMRCNNNNNDNNNEVNHSEYKNQ